MTDGLQRPIDSNDIGDRRRVEASLSEREERFRLLAQVQDLTARKQAEDALRASEEEHRAIFDLSGVGMAQADLATGQFTRVNRKFCDILGYSASELTSKTFLQITHPDDVSLSFDAAHLMLAGESTGFSTEKRYLHKDGRVIWVSVTATVIRDAGGRPHRAVATVIDVTERRRSEALEHDRRRVLEMVARDMPLTDVLGQLAEAVERQIDGVHAAIMVVQDGAIVLHGPTLPAEWREAVARRSLRIAASLSRALPASPDESCGVTYIRSDEIWEELRTHAQRIGVRACWASAIRSSDGTPLGVVTVYHREHRMPMGAESQTLDMAGKLASICVEHHNTTRQLAHLVRHDPLTGLPNRLCFEDRFGQAMAMARRTEKKVALIALDVDHFKQVNDTLGHDAGDALLQLFAVRLMGQLRETDTLARIGGDEFLLILPDLTGPEGAVAVANKLLECLREPFAVGGKTLAITSSLGIAMYPEDGQDSGALQRAADAQMYIAKRGGRNGFAIGAV